MKTDNQKSFSKKQLKQPNSFIKYSGLAFQFLAAALLGFWLGKWLDETYSTQRPWFAMVFVLLFIIATLIKTIRDISHESDL